MLLQHRSASSSHLSLIIRIYLDNQPTCLNRDNRRPANIAFSVPLRSNTKYRNINLFPIDYAFRPRLRGRLTLPRLTLDRNPWSSGERAFHPFYRYLRQHSHFCSLQQASQLAFSGLQNAPLPLAPKCKSAASVSDFSPVTSSAQADSTSELLRFL